MAAAEVLDETVKLSFKLRVLGQYGPNEAVYSPVQRLGRCSTCCLKLVPHAFRRDQLLGATEYKPFFAVWVIIIPDVLWSTEWNIPGVSFSITLVNHVCSTSSLTESDVFDFGWSNDCERMRADRGWRKFIESLELATMRRQGWINDDGDMLFEASLTGIFDYDQPLRNNLSFLERMWASPKFTDVVLLADGAEELHCHLGVLANASPVLESMLTSELQEGEQKRVVMKDVSPETLRAFVAFIYCEKLPAVADFTGLLRLADMYDFPKLAQLCACKLSEQVTEATVSEIFNTLNLHKRSLEVDSLAEFAKRAKTDKHTCLTLSRHLLKESNNFQEQVLSLIASDADLMGRLVTAEMLVDAFNA